MLKNDVSLVAVTLQKNHGIKSFLTPSMGRVWRVNLLSGISSRPLSAEAMIATCFTIDHNPQVCGLVCVVEVKVRLSI